jgi:hypothetical protein
VTRAISPEFPEGELESRLWLAGSIGLTARNQVGI